MSRSLRLVFSALFLAAAVTASAGPDDIFNAGTPGAFQPGQKEFLLALENGRYALKEGRIIDARPADPPRSALTNAKVAELLRGTRGGGGGGADPVAALGDAANQRALSRLSNPNPPQTNFDGGAARAGGVRGPPPTGATGSGAVGQAAAGAADPTVLQAQFLQRLVFKGTPAERAALAESVSTILQSPTGRQLAAQFVAEKASAEIKLAVIEHSKAVGPPGKKTVTGTAGMTETEKVPPVVTLSRAYLDTDPAYRRLAMAGTLAHELFGHAFEDQRARKAGLTHDAHYYYRGDEAGSRLIDWTIQTELAGKTVEGDPSKYLEDVEGYYAITLSLKEMKNPAATLKGRRAAVAAAAVESAKGIQTMKEWRPIVEHFATTHHVSRTRLKSAEQELADYFGWADIHAVKLVEIKEAIEGRIKYWETPEGLKVKKSVIAAADAPYLKNYEATLAARAKTLRRLRAKAAAGGRGPSSDGPGIVLPDLDSKTPKGDSVDLDALGVMYSYDLKSNPRHWKK